MPTGVTHWTGIWCPGMEALSNEVQAVRAALAPGPVVSFSMGQRSRIDWRERALCLSARRWLTLRAVAALVEPWGALTHAWGGISDWHFPRALGRRPLVYTIAFGGSAHPAVHYDSVRMFAVEAESLSRTLEQAGIPPSRIRVVYPGVDLTAFAPGEAPIGRFQLLFASAPARVEEFASRGISLLVETARACPDIDVVLLWREWGDTAAARRTLAAMAPPMNIRMVSRGSRSMADVYRSAHAVFCVYSPGFGKAAPNSVVESVACGRPVIVAESCGLAPLVVAAGAGLAIDATPDSARAAIDAIQRQWSGFSGAARRLAECHFSAERFVAGYARIYADALS